MRDGARVPDGEGVDLAALWMGGQHSAELAEFGRRRQRHLCGVQHDTDHDLAAMHASVAGRQRIAARTSADHERASTCPDRTVDVSDLALHENRRKAHRLGASRARTAAASSGADDAHDDHGESATDAREPDRPSSPDALDRTRADSSGTRDCVYFYSHRHGQYRCFSQFYDSPFTDDDGVFYLFAEQYLMAAKARLFGDTETERRIMVYPITPDQCKQLGRRVRNYNEATWNAVRFEVAVQGNMFKFRQNFAEQLVLRHTKDAVIAEAAPSDKVWGIGISELDARAGAVWRGSNLLGKVLMHVRRRLLLEHEGPGGPAPSSAAAVDLGDADDAHAEHDSAVAPSSTIAGGGCAAGAGVGGECGGSTGRSVSDTVPAADSDNESASVPETVVGSDVGADDGDCVMTSASAPPDAEPFRGFEFCAGKCLCSRVVESFGDMVVDGICELDDDDAAMARVTFPHAAVTQDFFSREWRLWARSPDVLFLLACTPCNPVADSGRHEGLSSPDIYITVSAMPEVVSFFGIPFFAGEQHYQLAQLDDGSVLEAFDGGMAAVGLVRTPIVDEHPGGVEVFQDLNHPEQRRRLALHYERSDMIDLIGPCPQLRLPTHAPLCLFDIMEPTAAVPSHLFLPGTLTLVPVELPLERNRPTVAAILTMGASHWKLFRGARVRLVDVADSPLYVVYYLNKHQATLFLDSRRQPEWVRDVEVHRLAQEPFELEVLHPLSVARCQTSFGVPPVGPCKQLVLDDGRARLLTTTEMFRLGGDEAALRLYRDALPDISEFNLRSKPGKSLQFNLAYGICERLRARVRAYVDVLNGAPPATTLPATTLAEFRRPLADSAVVVVFVSLALNKPLFLGGYDLESLPAVPTASAPSHRSALDGARPLLRAFEDSLGYVPEAFLAGRLGELSTTYVLACPLGPVEATATGDSQLQWFDIDTISGSPLYNYVALAYGTVLSMLDRAQCHGCARTPARFKQPRTDLQSGHEEWTQGWTSPWLVFPARPHCGYKPRAPALTVVAYPGLYSPDRTTQDRPSEWPRRVDPRLCLTAVGVPGAPSPWFSQTQGVISTSALPSLWFRDPGPPSLWPSAQGSPHCGSHTQGSDASGFAPRPLRNSRSLPHAASHPNVTDGALATPRGCIDPRLPDGIREARRAPLVPAMRAGDDDAWKLQRHRVRALEDSIRLALLAVNDDDVHATYLREWAAQVKGFDLDEVPVLLRGVDVDLDDDLSTTPFAFRDGAPITAPKERPAPQSTEYKPRAIEDILTADALRKIADWYAGWAPDMARNAAFEMPPDLSKADQQEVLLAHRRWRTPLCLGEEAFVPEAFGVIWDLRQRHADGYFVPLDYEQPLRTHLDLAYIRTALKRSRDLDMLSQLVDTGVTFGADVPMQIVLLPHLTSLPTGYRRVDRELHRLADCGYTVFEETPPLIPFRSIMQGAVARKYEADRPRRISDAGAWRRPLADGSGVDFTPLNTAIGATHVETEGAPYTYGNDEVVTTGRLGAVNAPARVRSTREHTRLPPEIKPRMTDVMHDVAVLSFAGRIFGLEPIILTDDFKDFFNQFAIAPWDLWKIGFPWVRAADADSATPCWVHERTLGFGYTNASNFAQRVAWAIVECIAAEMDLLDVPFFDNTDDMTEAQKRYVLTRLELSAITGRNELRLFSVQHMYTDDPLMLVLGTVRMVRLLRVWANFVLNGRWRMAIPQKRQIGAASLWCGITHVPVLGMHIIPKPKLARACADLRRVIARTNMDFGDYRSLCGLLESLLPWAQAQRDCMFYWYHVHRAAGIADNPGADVTPLLNDEIVASAARWLERLAGHPGTHCASVFTTTDFVVDVGVAYWYLYMDAALEPDVGGLGGYCHGVGWSLPLDTADRVGPYKLPITVCEYIAIYASLAINADRIPDNDRNFAVIGSDSLGSVDAMVNLKSKTPLMQHVTVAIRDSPEFVHLQRRLGVAHVFGTGNIFADAESRSRSDTVSRLVEQLQVEYENVAVPARVVALLDEVRARHRVIVDITTHARHPTEVEGHRGKRHRSNDAGDGKSDDGSDTDGDRRNGPASPDSPPPFRQPPIAASPRPRAVRATSAQDDIAIFRTPPRPDRMRFPSRPRSRSTDSDPTPFRSASRSDLSLPTPTTLDRASPLPVAAHPRASPRSSDERADSRGRPMTGPTQISVLTSMCDILDVGNADWALRPRNPERLRQIAARGDGFAAGAIPDGTIGVDKSGWRKWTEFLVVEFSTANPWRMDPDVQRGEPAAVNREVTLLALFYVWTFSTMRPRRRDRKMGKPQSALNVVAAVRRIHRRANHPMPPCPMIAIMLKGMSDEYVRVHGDRRFLLPERKEPLSKEFQVSILTVQEGTAIPPHGVVAWSRPDLITFGALLSSMCATGMRCDDALCSRSLLQPFDLTADDLTWYIRRPNGEYARVMALPPSYTLCDGDCAVLVSGGSKNDTTGEAFGTQPMYLPYVSSDVTNTAVWLQRYQRTLPIAAANRTSVALFRNGDGTPMQASLARSLFSALALPALGAAVCSTISLHSCRVWLACALLACDASRPLVMALARWKTPESAAIYGRLNPSNYAMWLRRIATAKTTSKQVTTLREQNLWMDQDEAHVNLSTAAAQLQHADVEATCPPPSSSDDETPVATTVTVTPRRPRLPGDTRIQVAQDNPKLVGSMSYCRYEDYKSATTRSEFILLGGTSADFTHDLRKGYIVIVDDALALSTARQG